MNCPSFTPPTPPKPRMLTFSSHQPTRPPSPPFLSLPFSHFSFCYLPSRFASSAILPPLPITDFLPYHSPTPKTMPTPAIRLPFSSPLYPFQLHPSHFSLFNSLCLQLLPLTSRSPFIHRFPTIRPTHSNRLDLSFLKGFKSVYFQLRMNGRLTLKSRKFLCFMEQKQHRPMLFRVG